MRVSKTRMMTNVAIMAVIALVIQMFDFALPIFPSFLQIDLSDVPALLSGFAFGPLAGVLVEAIKNVLHFMFKSSTGGVGEIANFIIGSALVIPAALIYKRKKSKGRALLGLSAGIVSMAVVGGLMNYFILLPFYSSVAFPMEAIVGMGTAINPNIVDVKTLILYAITPFNILKGVLVSVATMLLYKYVSPILHGDRKS